MMDSIRSQPCRERGCDCDAKQQGGQLSPAVGPSRAAITLGLGSMAIGGITSVAILNNNAGAGNFVVLIWIIIGIINVVYARRR